jgi:multiple sugar transport system permease protein
MAVRASKISYHERVARRNILRGLLFISPAILGFFIFTVFPIITSLYYSFTNYNILQPANWIGFENYQKLFQDRLFIISLKNTLFMVFIGLSIHFTFDFLIALLLNIKIRGISIFRTIFYLPTITPVVASAVLWLWIFNGRIGLLNGILNSVGLAPLGWLTDPNLTKPSYILMGLWAGGQTILIFLAGLQDVPTEQLESAELDGAGALSKTWHITLPTISPVIFYLMVLNMISYFQIFTEAWILTSTREGAAGGPANSLLFYSMYLYQNAFQRFKMGYASSQAWILLLIVLVATFILFRSSGWVYYRSDDK